MIYMSLCLDVKEKVIFVSKSKQWPDDGCHDRIQLLHRYVTEVCDRVTRDTKEESHNNKRVIIPSVNDQDIDMYIYISNQKVNVNILNGRYAGNVKSDDLVH